MTRIHCFTRAQEWWLFDRTYLAGHWSQFIRHATSPQTVIKRLDILPFQAQNDRSESSQQKLINYAKLQNMTPQKDMDTDTRSIHLQQRANKNKKVRNCHRHP